MQEKGLLDNIIIGNHPVLSGFTWENIPKLAIIAGINGSGKTRLLEAIYNKTARPKLNNLKPTEIHPLNVVQYIPYINGIGPNDFTRGKVQTVQDRKTKFLEIFKKFKNQEGISDNDFHALRNEIEKHSDTTLDKMTEEQFLDCLSYDYVTWIENGFENKYISEVFKAYLLTETKLKSEYFEYDKEVKIKSEDIISKIGKSPWIMINELFDKYGFHYHITKPELDIDYISSFKEKKGNISINFNELSSGEKLIVNLILWASNKNVGSKNKILLLDEFDAHLNPSLSKMYIEIIRDKIVNEFDIQVIMTTHSPSTVAYARDEELFWMERGRGISQSSKAQIIPILSDGIISVNEDMVSLNLDYTINLSPIDKPILLVEGITDKIILTKAWSTLCPNQEQPFVIQDFFDCYFITNTFKRETLFENYPNRLFIGLIDFDDAYDNWVEKYNPKKYTEITPKSYISYNSTSFAHSTYKANMLILPIPEYRKKYAGLDIKGSKLSIELLFQNDIITPFCEEINCLGDLKLLKFKDKNKIKFAREIQLNNNPETFASFKPIFDAIGEIITLQQNKVEQLI